MSASYELIIKVTGMGHEIAFGAVRVEIEGEDEELVRGALGKNGFKIAITSESLTRLKAVANGYLGIIDLALQIAEM